MGKGESITKRAYDNKFTEKSREKKGGGNGLKSTESSYVVGGQVTSKRL